VGHWQRLYFPAFATKEKFRLVIAAPSAATKEPMRRWVAEADDAHLRNIVEQVFMAYGAENIAAFWLVGHSQGGMTANRLLGDDFFEDRVDGWLSLSGGRIGPIELPASFFAGRRTPPLPQGDNAPGPASFPTATFFIFTCREHEMVALPATSPWRRSTAPAARERWPTSSMTSRAESTDTTREGTSTPAWG